MTTRPPLDPGSQLKIRPPSPTFTFGYSLGDSRFAHLEVPMDLTPEEEARLRDLIDSRVFGGFVKSIDNVMRERQAPDEAGR